MPNNLYRIILAVVAFAITAFYFIVNPAKSHFTPVCILHKTTGFYCFGCGGQRAFHSLLHGRFGEALQNNLLIYLILPIVVIILISEIINDKKAIKTLQKPVFMWGFIILLLAFMILRNLPVYPFNLMIPHN
ncbi:MAG: DUF2752 domain-containing protein [Spirosomataceae bacterium]